MPTTPLDLRGLTPILNVQSVPSSFAWFESLGWRRGFAWNRTGLIAGGADRNVHGEACFGSVCAGNHEVFLCCGAQGARGTIRPRHAGDDETDGVWMSWWLGSLAALDALHATALRLGLDVTMSPTDKPWGLREFHLRHPDGHMFRVSAGLAGEAGGA